MLWLRGVLALDRHNLIVIEGLDGSGKGTQTSLLHERITAEGFAIRQISFPNYAETSAALVKSYLAGEFGRSPQSVNAYAASSFYAVDRYAAYKKHWEADYLSGVNILADRYTTSNAVYQMTKLPPAQWDDYLAWLEHYEYVLLALPKPDVVIYLDMPPEISQKLMSGRYGGDESRKDIHEADIAFQKQCRQSALYAANKFGWHVIACSEGDLPRGMEEISEEIWGIVRKSLIQNGRNQEND